jgi:hypothetical protein
MSVIARYCSTIFDTPDKSVSLLFLSEPINGLFRRAWRVATMAWLLLRYRLEVF